MSVNDFVCQLVISYVSDDFGFGLVLVRLNSQRPISVLHGVHPPCDRDIQSGCTPRPHPTPHTPTPPPSPTAAGPGTTRTLPDRDHGSLNSPPPETFRESAGGRSSWSRKWRAAGRLLPAVRGVYRGRPRAEGAPGDQAPGCRPGLTLSGCSCGKEIYQSTCEEVSRFGGGGALHLTPATARPDTLPDSL